jgi:hypothetical protein
LLFVEATIYFLTPTSFPYPVFRSFSDREKKADPLFFVMSGLRGTVEDYNEHGFPEEPELRDFASQLSKALHKLSSFLFFFLVFFFS